METQERVEYFNFETLNQIDPLYFKPHNKVVDNVVARQKLNKLLGKKPTEKIKKNCNKCLGYFRCGCRLGFKQEGGIPLEICPKPLTNFQLNTIDEWKNINLKNN